MLYFIIQSISSSLLVHKFVCAIDLFRFSELGRLSGRSCATVQFDSDIEAIND
jgi:hypothetical protein